MTDPHRALRIFAAVYLTLLVGSLWFERPEFRAWEVAKDPKSEFFFPNRTIEMTEIGDLGFRSWVAPLQHPRPGRFSTDAYGFRNPPGIERPRVVVIGDSFVAGAGLRDEETLAGRLSALLGEPVYSVAAEIANSPSLYLSDRRFFRDPPRVVVFAPINRLVMPLRLHPIPPLRERPPRSAARWTPREIAHEIRRVNQVLGRDNALSRAMRFAYNGLAFRLFGHRDVILADGVPALALSLAEQKCFLTPEQRELEATIATTKRFADAVASRGVTLVYAPVPDSAEVYPELFPAEQLARCARPSLFDRLVPEAGAAGLLAVDLREALRAHKAPYLYHRDDSHWNPRGVELAAAALAERIRPLLAGAEVAAGGARR